MTLREKIADIIDDADGDEPLWEVDAAKETEAYASTAYGAALEQFKIVSERYYELQDEREAASAIIEGWRTQQSDLRAAGRVG